MLERGSQLLEGSSAFCRERQQVKRALNFIGGRSALWCLLNHPIGIGTPEAKAAHSGKAWLLLPRPRLRLGRDDQGGILQIDEGVQRLQMPPRRHFPIL